MKRIDEFDHIKELAEKIAAAVNPLRIYLFGSFAEGRNNEDSDYDFYVVMPDDDKRNVWDLMTEAQMAIVFSCKRPFDILVNKFSLFEKSKHIVGGVINEVNKKGVIIYER